MNLLPCGVSGRSICATDLGTHLSAYLENRARARQIQAWLRSDLMPSAKNVQRMLSLRVRKKRHYGGGKSQCRETVRDGRTFVSMGQPNLFGEWCIADTDLALMLTAWYYMAMRCRNAWWIMRHPVAASVCPAFYCTFGEAIWR